MGIMSRLFGIDTNPQKETEDKKHQLQSVKEREEIAKRLQILQLQVDVLRHYVK
jgi:hypothetical protein